ncbi:hypothetical protein TSUD_282800 [Trifolium subterraneum]|uniref:Uncharacterized protein n=1 Tax=Trifolium subterraneum TaxID=3900 RepID=A0A2Z6PQB3_TRISU|nr:hypothetical protein TSUD_282800 [Trifolium subterraneum]
MGGSQVLTSQGSDCDCRLLCETGPSGSTGSSFIQVKTEAMKEEAQVKLASFTYVRCFGGRCAVVDPNSEPGETRTRRSRRKDIDSAVPVKRTKVNMLVDISWLSYQWMLLVEAMKKIFGSLSRENYVLIIEEEESDAKGASEVKLANDDKILECEEIGNSAWLVSQGTGV